MLLDQGGLPFPSYAPMIVTAALATDRHESLLPVATLAALTVYCDCPNDASAAVVAKKLKELGFKRVRPLAGGIEAWQARGRPVDRHSIEAGSTV